MLCAVTDKLARDGALLSLADYKTLLKASENVLPTMKIITGTHVMYSDPILLGDQNSRRLQTLVVDKADQTLSQSGIVLNTDLAVQGDKLGFDMLSTAAYEEFKAEQLLDPTLEKLWEKAQDKSNKEFFISKIILCFIDMQLKGGLKLSM